jgi:hypothetical protein
MDSIMRDLHVDHHQPLTPVPARRSKGRSSLVLVSGDLTAWLARSLLLPGGVFLTLGLLPLHLFLISLGRHENISLLK